MKERTFSGTAGRKVMFKGVEYQLAEDIQVLLPDDSESWRYPPPIEPYAQVIRLSEPERTIEMNWLLYGKDELDKWAEAEDFGKCIQGIIETDDD